MVFDAPRPLVHCTVALTIEVAAPLVTVNGMLAEKFVPVASDALLPIHAANGAVNGTVKLLVWSVLPVAAVKLNAQLASSPVSE